MGSRGKEHTGGCSSTTKRKSKNEVETQLQKNKVDRENKTQKGKKCGCSSF